MGGHCGHTLFEGGGKGGVKGMGCWWGLSFRASVERGEGIRWRMVEEFQGRGGFQRVAGGERWKREGGGGKVGDERRQVFVVVDVMASTAHVCSRTPPQTKASISHAKLWGAAEA
ncbi:hypothetical protein Salat_1911500 [Sesamum alatum]|uniref:Uncharacterized protein n=1 Tax=Sesamum alatum TaxID=300844 RepID=A0AAE2CIE3_9LAMI|nr:hypothetical protein Salat_1911500 [Sesamum alatum]